MYYGIKYFFVGICVRDTLYNLTETDHNFPEPVAVFKVPAHFLIHETYTKGSKILFAEEKIEGLRCDVLLKQRRATFYRTSKATKLCRSILETKLLSSPGDSPVFIQLLLHLIPFRDCAIYLTDKIFHSFLL